MQDHSDHVTDLARFVTFSAFSHKMPTPNNQDPF